MESGHDDLFSALTGMTNVGYLYDYLGLAIGFSTTALVLIILTRGNSGYKSSSDR